MYQVSDAFSQLIKEDSRTFKALISIDDTIITSGIKSIKVNGGSNRGDDFTVGSAVSQYIEMTLESMDVQFESKELLLQFGLEVNGLVEYVPMGYFTTKKPDKQEDVISIIAYDRMMKMEVPCFLSLPDKTTTTAVLSEIENLTGVPVVTEGLDSLSIDKPVGYTCREVLSYIAQMYGGFAICNRTGEIEIRTYIDSNYEINTNRYWDGFTHSDIPYIVEKITCYMGQDEEGNDISVSAGSGTREISFSNPFMTQAILKSVWDVIGDFAYMPGSIRFLGDPCIDPWDILTVKDKNGTSYKVPVMSLTVEFDGGLTTEVEASGKSESEQVNGFIGPKTNEMDRYYAQLVLIDHALINKLDVDTAKITYATIQNLEAVNAHIQNLEVEYGEFEDLTAGNLEAIHAVINVLETDSANIKSLLSGNAGIGDLQNIHLTSANAVIDSALIRNAVMQAVTVNDLLAGTISTNKFRIQSDDGGISIVGATQQWKDKNGTVRMQAGLDANGDFTFALFNAEGTGTLIDDEGIHPGAIADGMIVNDMVADDAAIAGSKLDIVSLFEAMNGSTEVLKSSRIWFDEKNQNLSQVYSQMSSEITMAGSAADAAQDAAQKALEAVKGIDTLDAISAVLSNEAHVVHTNTDGSGGDYSDCSTKITVYSGDADVSAKATYEVTKSNGVTGTWNAQTRTYQVTGMTTDDGWVDIDALYGTGDMYLTDQSGNKLTTRDGKYLVVRTGGAHIKKRFSISKAPDGKIGVSYNLRCSTLVIRKQQDGTMMPSQVTFYAQYNDGVLLTDYIGRYKIEESTDGTDYAQKYMSAADELWKNYTPSSGNVKAIRCTLYSSGGLNELDSQSVIVLTDAEGLAEDIDEVRKGMQTIRTDVTNIQTGMKGIQADISSMQTDIIGVTDNTLLFNVQYNDNGNNTVTLTAKVYKEGKDVTSTFTSRWFTWWAKSESGEKYIGYGYGITVKKTDVGFGSTYIGRFITYETRYLKTRSGAYLKTRKGNRLTTWIET